MKFWKKTAIVGEKGLKSALFARYRHVFQRKVVNLPLSNRFMVMTDEIIGRHKEQALLSEYLGSGRAEFIAVYGRRRVGKTFLIRKYFKNTFAFDMTGVLEGTRIEQMAAFNTALKIYGYHGKKCNTWLDAFFALRELIERNMREGERQVIFIDELPCLDTAKAGFVNALGHFWNSWANWHPEIMLIVCGSATSWMVRNVIDNHGGLHDRVTHEMALHQFSLSEAEEFFNAKGFVWNRLSVMQAYMAVGGVPYYMSLFNRKESPAMAIDRLFFVDKAEMRSEYRRLFSSLFRNPQPYLDIITVLASKRNGLTRDEISQLLGSHNNGHLGDMLTDLEYCDFIRKYRVQGKGVKSTSGNDGFWTQNLETPRVNTWYGLAFERICQAHILQIKAALGISGIRSNVYSWRSSSSEKGAQIDMIIDRADNTLNICEIKYSKGEYDLKKDEYLKIRNRIDSFVNETSQRSSIVPTLITTFGVVRGAYSDQIPIQLTLDDLF